MVPVRKDKGNHSFPDHAEAVNRRISAGRDGKAASSSYGNGATPWALVVGRSHPVLGVVDRLLHIPNRALPPATFIMLRPFQLGPSGSQMLKRTCHMGLLISRRSHIDRRNSHRQQRSSSQCFHAGGVSSNQPSVKRYAVTIARVTNPSAVWHDRF